MRDYRDLQQQLRVTGAYSTPPGKWRTSPAPVNVIHSFRYAYMVLRILWRCAWHHLHRRFDYDRWSEICSDSIRFAERLGATVTIEGFEQRAAYDGPVVYVSNHMSTLETMVFPTLLNSFGKLSIILKKSLEEIPLVGPASIAVGSIGVSRKNARADLVTVLEEGQKRLASGSSVLIFPQGTRREEFNAKHFNTLGAKLAHRAKVPLVPIAVRTDFQQKGRIIKDFGRIDPSKPLLFFGGPVLAPEMGTREIHAQSVRFIEERLRSWGLAVE